MFPLNFRISSEFHQISLSQLSSVCSESGWKWVSLAVRIEMATVKTPNSILFKCKIMQSYNSMALNIWTVQVQILFLPIEYLMQTPGIETQTVSDHLSLAKIVFCCVRQTKKNDTDGLLHKTSKTIRNRQLFWSICFFFQCQPRKFMLTPGLLFSWE